MTQILSFAWNLDRPFMYLCGPAAGNFTESFWQRSRTTRPNRREPHLATHIRISWEVAKIQIALKRNPMLLLRVYKIASLPRWLLIRSLPLPNPGTS